MATPFTFSIKTYERGGPSNTIFDASLHFANKMDNTICDAYKTPKTQEASASRIENGVIHFVSDIFLCKTDIL